MAAADGSTKRCPKCESSKPVSEFGVSKQRPDGLRGWCKACHNASERARWSRLSDEAKASTLARHKRWRKQHPELMRQYVRDHQKRNPEKTFANYIRWRSNNKKTVRAWARASAARRKGAAGKYTKADIALLMRAQRGRCAYCGTHIKKKFHVDHIQPIALGGSNDRRNLQLTCAKCNCSKKAQDPIEYAQSIGRLL